MIRWLPIALVLFGATLAAQTSATSLRQVLAAILRPTTQAKDAMTEYGLSAEGLRRQIADEGLLSVLNTMKDATRGDEEAFAAMLGRVNGVTGALALVGDAAGETQGIFQRMTNTTGSLEVLRSRRRATYFAGSQYWTCESHRPVPTNIAGYALRWIWSYGE